MAKIPEPHLNPAGKRGKGDSHQIWVRRTVQPPCVKPSLARTPAGSPSVGSRRLHGKRLEAALGGVAEADLVVRTLPALHAQVRVMLEGRRQVAILLRPEQREPVIGHHALAADPHSTQIWWLSPFPPVRHRSNCADSSRGARLKTVPGTEFRRPYHPDSAPGTVFRACAAWGSPRRGCL
jgi:hypothetical protein